MSFALEYRKKLQEQERAAHRARKENEGFVSLPADDAADTRGNRRRVMLALIIAGGILATFNSGSLVNYSYDLADSAAGQRLIELTEAWHDMMEETRAAEVVDHIRGSVESARESTWEDLTSAFALTRLDPGTDAATETPVLPANGAPLQAPVKRNRPETVKPDGPVMRASVDR